MFVIQVLSYCNLLRLNPAKYDYSRSLVMNRKRAKVFAIIILFFLVGCGTVGKNFNSTQIKSIQNNVTSQAEILLKFSLPFKKGIENGQTMWIYEFDEWNILGPAESKDLVILFDEKNIVSAHRYTTSKP